MNKKVEYFSSKDTNICKGIAILFMVLHHLVGAFYNSFDLNWYEINAVDYPKILLLFSSSGKVCVSLFTILSGYGMYKKYDSYIKETKKESYVPYIASRIAKFYTTYIPIFLTVFIYKCFTKFTSINSIISYYNNRSIALLSIIYLLIDLFGLYKIFGTNSIINDWFVTAIIIFYILFPLINKLTKKYKLFSILLLSFPWVISMCFGGIKNDTFYYYLSEYSLGIYLSMNGLLDKFKNKVNIKNKIVTTMLLLVSWILRLIFALPFDIILALAIILFEIQHLSNLNFNNVLSFLGKNSSNIWLLHSYCIGIISKIAYDIYNRYILTILLSLTISFLIEAIKKRIKIDNFVGKIKRVLLNNI